jgi:hypothetical protein
MVSIMVAIVAMVAMVGATKRPGRPVRSRDGQQAGDVNLKPAFQAGSKGIAPSD